MKLTERVKQNLEERRDRVLRGEVNSIPSPFKRFRDDFIGIEQARLYDVTSYTKVGKTQFASYVFLYTPLLYAYYNPDKVRVKIFYYPLEESPEQVLTRFISFLLFKFSGFKIVKSPVDLNSTKNVAIEQKILDLLETSPYKEILEFFEENVVFSDSQNPSGVWFEMQRYAAEHGTIYRTETTYKDEQGLEKTGTKFDHYEPDDPKEYRIIFYDHIGLTTPERGMSQREAMMKTSEYFINLRNKYGFTIVDIHQQAMTDNLEAIKSSKLRPTVANMGDSKTIARDVDMCIGLFSPFVYEIPEYQGYDIRKLRNNIRFAEILLNRHGQSGGMLPLVFVGQCNYWDELPSPKDTAALDKIYKWLAYVNGNPQPVFMAWTKKYINHLF